MLRRVKADVSVLCALIVGYFPYVNVLAIFNCSNFAIPDDAVRNIINARINICTFYLHYAAIGKVVFSVSNTRIYNKCMLCKMSAFKASTQAYAVWSAWIALSVEGIYCITELFWKQLLDEVQVKNNPNFVPAVDGISLQQRLLFQRIYNWRCG